MNAVIRSIVLFAVVGHVGLSVVDAFASEVASGAIDARPTADIPRADLGLMQLAQSTGGNGDGGGAAAGASGGGHGGTPFTNPYGAGATAASGSCSTGLVLSDPDAFRSPLAGLEAISKQTQTYIEQCACQTQGCIADALDVYANAIAKVTPRLPRAARRALRDLPAAVHAAARRARTAPTVRAAVAVLHEAVATVHKTIALMRAADPDAKRLATRGGDLVARTLDTAATSLERADTL
ncbi:MAG TPA: hypothetical protein VN715_17615 [Roseiarcus sp.]|nr:hypothetical protein [Roseiarcus sp.]